jgi:hypothetical protein
VLEKDASGSENGQRNLLARVKGDSTSRPFDEEAQMKGQHGTKARLNSKRRSSGGARMPDGSRESGNAVRRCMRLGKSLQGMLDSQNHAGFRPPSDQEGSRWKDTWGGVDRTLGILHTNLIRLVHKEGAITRSRQRFAKHSVLPVLSEEIEETA